MGNQNWSEIGSNISDMVQEAIDSEDFSKLSQAIQNTVSTAVSSAVNGAVSGFAQGMNEMGDSINRAADSMAGRSDRREAKFRTGNSSISMPEYMRGKKKDLPQAQKPWLGSRKFERKTSDYMRAKDIPRNELYSPGSSTRAGGYLLAGLGGICCFGLGMGTFTLALIALTTGANMAFPIGILLPLLAASIFVTCRGAGVLGRFRRFKNYVKALGNRTCITVEELAGSVGKSRQYIRKDLKQMIEKNMFLQGHLDAEGNNLFVTHEGYEAYLTSQQQISERKVRQLEANRKLEAQKKKAMADTALPEDVKKLLADGSEYIEKIRKSNDAIQDETVSAKLDGLEMVVSKILQYVEQHPDSAPETKKLMRYYLPTTIKLLDSYQKLNDQPVQGENIRKSKKEIEDTLDTLNQAFARLFDNLYQDTSVDIASDISVLNTLLAQEGLTGERMNR